MIDAILMAAGFSRRFGEADKLLTPFHGVPLARHTLDLVCGLADLFGNIFFVTASEPVAALARGLPVTPLHNEAPERGQRESIRLGVSASNADYYLFLACDMPRLTPATLRRVIEARRPGRIVEARRGGQPANPSLWSAAFREELLALGPGEKGRDLKARYRDRVIGVEAGDPWELEDVDTPEGLG